MAGEVTLRTDAGDEHLDLDDFEARVRQGEVSPQSLVRVPAVTGDTFVPACELELYRRLDRPRQAHFRRSFTLVRFPWFTSALILINLAVYLATTGGGQMTLDDMVRYGGKVGPLVRDLGQLWRLFTANFLHRDALHLGLNMFVLFNVGGALENTYRTLDYLWLLVFSGIVTMGTSLLLNDAITIGASGMVFGCLGGVVAFGLKYRSLLPARYRSILGDAAIPTVLGFLLIGVTSEGVDNWAHVGGLTAGTLMGAVMRPRLLAPARRLWWTPAVRAAPLFVTLAVVFFGQSLFFGGALPVLEPERDDAFGVEVPVPQGWLRGAGPLGSVAWFNGLSGLGRASFAVEAVAVPEGADAAAQARDFVSRRLAPRGLGADVLDVSAAPAQVVRVGERDAVRVKATIEETTGDTRLMAWFVPRGLWVYQFVFLWPAQLPRYEQVMGQMMAGVRFVEPRALRLARGRALLFPNSGQALERLGQVLLEQGDVLPAADALSAAVRLSPSDVGARVSLARAWLLAGEVDRGCASAEAAMVYAPGDAGALEAGARCELARHRPRAALERLEAASAAAPGDERLQRAVSALRAALPGLGPDG